MHGSHHGEHPFKHGHCGGASKGENPVRQSEENKNTKEQ
ncbi:hypothetical protein DOT_5145 [Desulfosporosinus sp. OT]|nr:hypothetical protein DOT_5145 [Desulfosporosinus sp. OT]